MGLSAAQLRARALACLAQREHSRAELRRKLLAALKRAAERADEALPDDAEVEIRPVISGGAQP